MADKPPSRGYQAPNTDSRAPGLELLPSNATICCFAFHFVAQVIPATCSRGSKPLRYMGYGSKWYAERRTSSRQTKDPQVNTQKFSGKHKVVFTKTGNSVVLQRDKKYTYSTSVRICPICLVAFLRNLWLRKSA